MTTIEQLEKHFKIRRNASSIMIKENNAEIFTEEQLKEMMQYCVAEAEEEGIENLHFEISSKSPNYNMYKNVLKRIRLNMLLKTSLCLRIYIK